MSKNIVIYQPSKVGSTTVIHHLLRHYNLKREQGIWCPSDNSRYPLDESVELFHTHTLKDMPKGLQEKVLGDDETYFICLTREPVSRNISGFFEPKQFHPTKNTKLELSNFCHEFITKFNHTGGIDWFDTEFLNMGFDSLYDLEFDKDKGYGIYENGKKKLLLLRMEDINDNLGKTLTEFIGEPISSEIQIENSSKDRQYKDIYNLFKEMLHVPDDILDSVYQTKHTKYFYTDKEIEKFYKKWRKTV